MPLSLGAKIFAWLVVAFLLLPTVVVIPIAFSDSVFMSFPPQGFSTRWFEAFFSSESWISAAARSVRVAVFVTLIATSIATFMAVVLSKSGPLFSKIVRTAIMAPMTLPVIVFAVAIYGVYAKLRLVGTDLGLILAHTALAMPYPFLTVTAAMATMDQSLLKAAASSGANPLRAFWWVTFPTIRPAVLAGALFAFLTSFDEVVVAMFNGGPQSTLPKRMLDDIRFELSPILAAIAALLTCFTAIVIVGATRKRLTLIHGR